MDLSYIRRPEALMRRFWAKVDRNGPIPAHRPELGSCWLWTGARSRVYGNVCLVLSDGHRLYTRAHRVALLLEQGNVTGSALHHCDVPLCVRPSHLFEGTQTENLEDMTAKGRRSYRAHYGSDNGRAVLNEEKVHAIRERLAAGETVTELARAFGVSWSTIGRIRDGKRWVI